MNIVDIIKNIVSFTSNIWQVHPFREGNTRTIAVFIELYLNSLGYDVNNEIFKRKSVHFRNALVRSNYYNDYLNVKEDKSYLTRFYENLLLGKNNNLSSEDLKVCGNKDFYKNLIFEIEETKTFYDDKKEFVMVGCGYLPLTILTY